MDVFSIRGHFFSVDVMTEHPTFRTGNMTKNYEGRRKLKMSSVSVVSVGELVCSRLISVSAVCVDVYSVSRVGCVG